MDVIWGDWVIFADSSSPTAWRWSQASLGEEQLQIRCLRCHYSEEMSEDDWWQGWGHKCISLRHNVLLFFQQWPSTESDADVPPTHSLPSVEC